MGLTRRGFLERLGAAGGYSAVYLGMEAMGLLNVPPASAEPFALPPQSGRGRKVVILGAGIAGASACQAAVGIGARVTILDVNPTRLRYVSDILGGHVTTLMSNRANIEEEVVDADLVVGTVLIPGAKAPKLISRALLRSMRPGSALVDVSIDQGGCIATAHPTTHRRPIYVEEGVVHYAVTNMPAIVPHTSTYALTNATLHYALLVADLGFEAAIDQDPALRRGVNTHAGKVTHQGVANAFGLDRAPLEGPRR